MFPALNGFGELLTNNHGSAPVTMLLVQPAGIWQELNDSHSKVVAGAQGSKQSAGAIQTAVKFAAQNGSSENSTSTSTANPLDCKPVKFMV